MNITYGFGQTPSSNTGSNSFILDNSNTPTASDSPLPFDVVAKPKPKFTACVDWLQGVCVTKKSQFDFVIGEVGSIFRDVFEDDDKPKFTGRTFAHSRRSPKGATIAWNYLDGDRVDWWLCLPATMLRGCGSFHLRRFISFLFDMGFKCTRIDLALDDYTKSLDKKAIESACDADLHHFFATYGEYYKKTRDKPKGWTFYMGSFESDKLYRFYDKSVESDGEIDAYRLEGQYRDDYAKQIFQFLNRLSNSHESFLKTITNIVCGLIDFYSGKAGKTSGKGKFERCPFWQEFIDFVGSVEIELTSGRDKSSIERSLNWVETSVERTLATIEEYYEGLGQDFAEYLHARLEAGRRKIRNVHKTIVKSSLLQLGVNESVSYTDVCNGFF